ncbi:MAG: molybdate ABC transporter substrate-binding protein [Acidobacteriota bacterium]|nr:molybdate ABC transporter substrate-binding protein [Acidobacteriota bacterium]MDH3522893.1 molybdate ABC transporter substrate-binding protein [Acidobacteriota bacterium]
MVSRELRPAVAALLVGSVLAGCARGGAAPATVTVSAAASLGGAFAALEPAFEAAHPGLDVALNLAGSSVLREQILGGAPVDVFAAADERNLDPLVEAGAVAGAPRVFARNRLQIAVPAGNPAAVRGLADFARAELWIGLCAAEAPCGAYAERALAAAAVVPSVDTREPNARALAARIGAGELDAGIVYATDVGPAGAEGIVIPEDRNVVAVYPIAVLAAAPNPGGAAAFVEFVLSDAGRAVMTDHGFSVP